MSYIGLRTNKRNGENMQFKDAITFEFALDTSPSNGTRTRALLSDSGSFELKGIVKLPEGQNLALGSPGTTDVTLTGTGSIIGEGTVTGGGFG